MGLFSGITKAFSSVTDGLGGLVKGIGDFAKSPFGKMLINVGLSFLTGGTGGILSTALGALGGGGGLGGLLGGAAGGGGLSNIFQGFAEKFLGGATDLLSKDGLSSVAGFLSKAGGSGDLLSMAKSLLDAGQDAQTDQGTGDIVQNNLVQLFAKKAAELVTA